jgi:hypothetical protein
MSDETPIKSILNDPRTWAAVLGPQIAVERHTHVEVNHDTGETSTREATTVEYVHANGDRTPVPVEIGRNRQ